MAGRVPELSFKPYRFNIGDTISVVDKQNGQLDAMEAFAKSFNEVMVTVDEDVEEVRAAQADVVAKGEAAVQSVKDTRTAEQSGLSSYADQRRAEIGQDRVDFSDYADQRRAEIGQDRVDFSDYADQRKTEIDQVYTLADQRAVDSDESASLSHQYMESAQKTVTDGASVSDLYPAQWWVISIDTTLEENGWYRVDTSDGPLTLTLPAFPAEDAKVSLKREQASLLDSVIEYNGDLILGRNEDLEIDVNVASLTLVFHNGNWTIL